MNWRLEIPSTTNKRHVPFLNSAYRIGELYSEDTRTHTGAVLVRNNPHPFLGKTTILARGWNHFPPGLDEALKQPPEKYTHIIHAETAAIADARAYNIATNGLTMYMPWMPCMPCAKSMVSAGIERLIAHEQLISKTPERWHDDLVKARDYLQERGVQLLAYNGKVGGVTQLFNGEVWEP